MKPSQNAIQLIKNREKLRLISYKALSTEKYYTIGWGHYCDNSNKKNQQWNRAGSTITKQQADQLLYDDIIDKTKAIDSMVKVAIPQNLYDALVSTVFQFNPSSDKLKPLFRGINIGYTIPQIGQLVATVYSNTTFNKKARLADSILVTLGKVVHLETLRV